MLSLLMASAGAGLSSGLGIGSGVGWLGGHLASHFLTKNNTFEVHGRRLADLSVQTSTYGRPIPILYGQMILSGNIIWSSGIREVSQQKKIKVPGGQKIVETHYEYFVDLAIGLCEGPINHVLRIWANDLLVLDNTSQNSGPIAAYSSPIRFYSGTETQLPDPLIQSMEGVQNVPAFKGLAYLVLENFPLRDFNHKIPHFQIELSTNAKETFKAVDIPTISDDLDNIVFSENDPYLYLRDGNILQKINRITEKVELKHDLSEALPRTDLFPSYLFGKAFLDHEHATLYVFAQNHLSSFILAIDTEDFKILRHNFEDRLIADEWVGFLDNDLLYTADFLKGNIRVYHKNDLSRLDYMIHGSLQSGLHQRPTNFTKDQEGFLYLASYHAVEQKEIFLTKFRYGEKPTEFLIAEHGFANAIAFDQKTQSMIMNGSKGILKIDPRNGSIVKMLPKCNAISDSMANFLNQPHLRGFFWSFFGSKAFLINCENLQVEKEIDFRSLGVPIYGLCFDPQTHSLWSKGRGLHKVLIERFEGDPFSLDALAADLFERGGCKEFSNCLRDVPVFGYIISEPQTLAEAFHMLGLAYFFHWRDHEGKLELFHRDEADQLNINLKDLGAHQFDFSSGVIPSLHTLRGSIHSIPQKHILHYLSLKRLYDPFCQEINFSGGDSLSLSTQLPLVLSDDYAKNIACDLLELHWLRNHQCFLSLPPSYLKLEVGDSIICGPYHLFIEEMDIGANYQIELKTTFYKKNNQE